MIFSQVIRVSGVSRVRKGAGVPGIRHSQSVLWSSCQRLQWQLELKLWGHLLDHGETENWELGAGAWVLGAGCWELRAPPWPALPIGKQYRFACFAQFRLIYNATQKHKTSQTFVY